MGEHTELMQRLRLGRGAYLAALRKQQPMDELQRKANKARRSGIWTQEDIDLIGAVAVEMTAKIRLE
jgi:hypothetical protein